MQEVIIQVSGLSKTYGLQPGVAHTALHGIQLDVFEGEFLAIMGPSGSGKSTLLYLLSGLDQPTAGSIKVHRQMLQGRTEQELALFRRRSVGLVLQQNNLIAHLSLLENILLPGLLLKDSRKAVAHRAQQLLERFGLSGLGHRLPEEVSGGEQQRAAIARSLINRPEVLLADEPTGSLNSAASQAVLKVLQHLHEAGQTIVLVTHDIKTAAGAHRVLFMQDGLLAADSLEKIPGLPAYEHERRLLDWLVEKGW